MLMCSIIRVITKQSETHLRRNISPTLTYLIQYFRHIEQYLKRLDKNNFICKIFKYFLPELYLSDIINIHSQQN